MDARFSEASDELVQLQLDRPRVAVLAVLEQKDRKAAPTEVTVGGIKSQLPEKCQIGPVRSQTAVAPKAITSASGDPTNSGARLASEPPRWFSGVLPVRLLTANARPKRRASFPARSSGTIDR